MTYNQVGSSYVKSMRHRYGRSNHQTHISVMRGTHTCFLYNAPQPRAKLQRVQKGLLIIYKHMVYKSGLRRSGGIGTFYGRSAGEIMSCAEMSGTFFSDE